MKQVSGFQSKDCGPVLKLMDHFLAGELTVESSQEILLHLESCSTCRQEEKSRLKARRALNEGWSSQPVPSDLQEKIMDGLETRASIVPAFLLRVAALILVTLGLGVMLLFWLGPNSGTLIAQAHYDGIVGDHLNCSGHQTSPEAILPLDSVQTRIETALQEMGDSYRLLETRLCRVGEVEIVHYVFEGRGGQISVILEGKSNLEHLALQGNEPERTLEGVRVILLPQEQDLVTLAGLETPGYFVYLVGEEEEQTLQLAERIMPSLKAAL
jgi:hypothetical protein